MPEKQQKLALLQNIHYFQTITSACYPVLLFILQTLKHTAMKEEENINLVKQSYERFLQGYCRRNTNGD